MASKELGAKLQQLRKQNNLTQKDVYEMLGVSQSTFSSWEVGKSEPDAMTFLRLCDIYKVDDILLEFAGTSVEKKKDADYELFQTLDDIDKAEIRGEMKQMLKADKYNSISTGDIADDMLNDLKKEAATPIKSK